MFYRNEALFRFLTPATPVARLLNYTCMLMFFDALLGNVLLVLHA